MRALSRRGRLSSATARACIARGESRAIHRDIQVGLRVAMSARRCAAAMERGASEEIMISKWMAAAAVASGSVLFAGAASAQSEGGAAAPGEQRSSEVAPAARAVELTIATGYAQGFGNVASGQPSLTDVGLAGGAVEVGAGYRFVPQLSLGVYGSGAMFGRGDSVDKNANLYSATAGVEAGWHFLPARSIDPWISLGTGWRGYWVSADRGTTSQHGLELAKLRVGVDYRLSQSVSISPVIGADMSLFLTQSTPGADGYSSISSPNVNTFVFGGVLGRFDIATGGASTSRVASR
jgi:hypothetical protein